VLGKKFKFKFLYRFIHQENNFIKVCEKVSKIQGKNIKIVIMSEPGEASQNNIELVNLRTDQNIESKFEIIKCRRYGTKRQTL